MKYPRIKQKYSCGPAAVRFCLLHLLDVGVSEEGLMKQMKTDKNGMTTLPFRLMKCLRTHGLQVRGYHDMSIKSLKKHLLKGRLVITPFWDHYYIVLVVDGEEITFFCPLQNRLKMSIDEFERRWIDKDSTGKIYNNYGIVVKK